MSTYLVSVERVTDDMVTLKVGFNPDKPADNTEIVVDARSEVEKVKEQLHGKVVLIHGPASLPVAVMFGHELSHVVKAVAVYDPKMAKYIVCVSHDAKYNVGDVVYF